MTQLEQWVADQRALHGATHVNKRWSDEAQAAFLRGLLDRGAGPEDARVLQALRASERTSGGWSPTPGAVLAKLDELGGGAEAQQKAGISGRSGCPDCRSQGTAGFRMRAVLRPDGSHGVAHLADCVCHAGRDPLADPLPPSAIPGSRLVFVLATDPGKAAEERTDAKEIRASEVLRRAQGRHGGHSPAPVLTAAERKAANTWRAA